MLGRGKKSARALHLVQTAWAAEIFIFCQQKWLIIELSYFNKQIHATFLLIY